MQGIFQDSDQKSYLLLLTGFDKFQVLDGVRYADSLPMHQK